MTSVSDRSLVFDLSKADCPIACEGFSGVEPAGRWTDGRTAELRIAGRTFFTADAFLLVYFDLAAFTHPEKWPRQSVKVSVNGASRGEWVITLGGFRRRALVVERSELGPSGDIRIRFDLPDHAAPASLEINPDTRSLGIMLKRIVVCAASERPAATDLFWRYGRPVGGEASKTFDERIESGFWTRFVKGTNVLDIGFRGYLSGIAPILEGAIGVDVDYPGYDGRRLPFENDSQDAVFSSHCLEHISDYVNAIQEWHRVVRIGGHVIVAVPSADLYERGRRPPSRWNGDHKRFYTPARLLAEYESALAPNSYRVRFLEENDRAYRYDLPPDVHPAGCYEIVLVTEKISPPAWGIEP